MPAAPVRPHVAQAPDVVHQLPAQVVLQRQRAELGGEVVNLPVAQRADARRRVDVEAGHQLRADGGPEAVEGGEGARDESLLGEVDAEDEDLGF